MTHNPFVLPPGSEGEGRADYVGGSDAQHVMGLDPYGCRRRGWLEKAGLPPDVPQEQTRDMTRGKRLEHVMVQELLEDAGLALHPVPAHEVDLPVSVAAHDCMKVHVDALFAPPTAEAWARLGGEGEPPRTPGVGEVKVPRRETFHQILRDGPKLAHLAQTHHGMILTGCEWGVVSASWADGWEHVRWLVRWDDALVKHYLQAVGVFWREVEDERAAARLADLLGTRAEHDATRIKRGPPRLPPNDARCRKCPWRLTCHGQAYVDALGLEAIGPDEPVLQVGDDPQWREALAQYLEAKAAIEDADMDKQAAVERMKALMAGRTVAHGQGVRIYWRKHVQQRIDTALLRSKYPQIAKECTVATPQQPFKIIEV